MDYCTLIGLLAVQMLAAQDQDPAEILTRTRDKTLAMVEKASRYRCTETIERKYVVGTNPRDARSCDEIEGQRARGRVKLRLERVDRIRLEASMPADAEVFSWTGVAPRWIKLQDIIESGPISTGSMGPYLAEILRNPSVQYRFLKQDGSEIDYAFEVALETSRSLIRGGAVWQPHAYEGTFTIDSARLELRNALIRAQTVPTESHVCSWETELGYRARAYEDARLLLPDHNVLRFVQLDGKETENEISFSQCEDYRDPEQPESLKFANPLPPGIEFPLVLDTPLNLTTAAAGDRITARVSKEVEARFVVIPKGAEVDGRIVRFQREVDSHRFLIGVEFETIRIGKVYHPLYATIRPSRDARREDREQGMPLRHPVVDFSGLSRPAGTLIFADTMTVSEGFETLWITVKEP
jgi:hypothetical protein